MKCPDKKSYPESVLEMGQRETQVTITRLLDEVRHMIPDVQFTHFNDTTSAYYSKATLIDPHIKYCVGDHMIFQVEAYDYLRKRKKYGGDFIRGRIYSPELKASASGDVTDWGNGTYNINFTLFWEGKVKISILLHHSSEIVSALWRVRNIDYLKKRFRGKFINNGKQLITECGLQLESKEKTCDYLDHRDGEFFYCIKPPNISCDALTAVQGYTSNRSHLTPMEKEIIAKSKVAVEISKTVDLVIVHQCQGRSAHLEPKCKPGVPTSFPSGYFLKGIWNPVFCNLTSFSFISQAETCLTRKMVYLLGDSTIYQWMTRFTKLMPSLKFFDIHESEWDSPSLALDVSRNIYIYWKKHGHPFLYDNYFTVKSYSYVAHEIDNVSGGPNIIVVITLGHHFRPFPLSLFIRRMLNVRQALERLLLRSPGTQVFFKTENNREKESDLETFSDFNGYIQYKIAKNIFKDLNIGMIDAWDMTNAYGSYDLHPCAEIVNNQINLFLAYICTSNK
ncbi:NXPE family member 1-like [Bombina bombina]|uniref:NXPE family member 1-like n=1 Tax=Bombina bombina TaxID=8345 RepID=UPI00235AD8CF|nr:NXPE family member 1-like [Bombina bombina]